MSINMGKGDLTNGLVVGNSTKDSDTGILINSGPLQSSTLCLKGGGVDCYYLKHTDLVGPDPLGVFMLGAKGADEIERQAITIQQNVDYRFHMGFGTSNPQKIVDINSTVSGMLPPRMTTTERDAISAVTGEFLYNTTVDRLQCWNGTTWKDCFT